VSRGSGVFDLRPAGRMARRLAMRSAAVDRPPSSHQLSLVYSATPFPAELLLTHALRTPGPNMAVQTRRWRRQRDQSNRTGASGRWSFA
jgi:hypothetical protein